MDLSRDLDTDLDPTARTPWDDTDERFFRLVAHVLPAPLVEGASCLLATYDDDRAVPHPQRGTVPAAATRRGAAAGTVTRRR